MLVSSASPHNCDANQSFQLTVYNYGSEDLFCWQAMEFNPPLRCAVHHWIFTLITISFSHYYHISFGHQWFSHEWLKV